MTCYITDEVIIMYDTIKQEANSAMTQLLDAAHLQAKDLLVVGCSSSEIGGQKIGSGSSINLAEAVFSGLYPVLKDHGIFLAAQCCEHLNRALILEKEAAVYYGYPLVNVVPQPKAGGSFATTAYHAFSAPVAVEKIQAHAGMDIGDTLIGMHLAPVAVPVRLDVKTIGEARVVCARVRPKFIGGERAMYDNALL